MRSNKSKGSPPSHKKLQCISCEMRRLVESQKPRFEKKAVEEVFNQMNTADLADAAFAGLMHIMDHFSDNPLSVFKCLKFVYILLELDHLRFFEIARNFIPEIETVRFLNFRKAKLAMRKEIHALARALLLHLTEDGPLPMPDKLDVADIVVEPIVPKVRQPEPIVNLDEDMIEWNDAPCSSTESGDFVTVNSEDTVHESSNSLFECFTDVCSDVGRRAPKRSPSQDLFTKGYETFAPIPKYMSRGDLPIIMEELGGPFMSHNVARPAAFLEEPSGGVSQSANLPKPYDLSCLLDPGGYHSPDSVEGSKRVPTSLDDIALIDDVPIGVDNSRKSDMFEPIPQDEVESPEFEPISPRVEEVPQFEPIEDEEVVERSVPEFEPIEPEVEQAPKEPEFEPIEMFDPIAQEKFEEIGSGAQQSQFDDTFLDDLSSLRGGIRSYQSQGRFSIQRHALASSHDDVSSLLACANNNGRSVLLS